MLGGLSALLHADRWADFFRSLGRFFYSCALIVNLALPLLAVSLIWNLRAGMVNWHTQSIFKDREARRITIQRSTSTETEDGLALRVPDAPGRGVGYFADAEIDYLRVKFPNELNLDFKPVGVFGYSRYRPYFAKINTLSPTTSLPRGQIARSVSPEDPLLEDLNFFWKVAPDGGPLFTEEGIGEVVIPSEWAEHLGMPLELETGAAKSSEPVLVDLYYQPTLRIRPDHVEAARYRVGYDPVEKVRVMGVYEGTTQDDFIITHDFVALLPTGAWYKEHYYINALMGPLTGELDPEEVKTALPFLEKAGISFEALEYDGGVWLGLERIQGAGPMKRRTWESGVTEKVTRYWDQIKSAKLGPEVRFPQEVSLVQSSVPIRYERIDVETEALEQISVLADIFENWRLKVSNDDNVKGARRIVRQNQAWGGVQVIVLAVTALLAIISLVLALSQRIYQKTSEIGILRAFGAPQGLIRRIYLLQGIVIWVLAAGLSVLTAPPLLSAAAPIFFQMTDLSGGSDDQTEEAMALAQQEQNALFAEAFTFRYDLFGITCGIALVLTVIVTLFATQLAARIDPAAALKTK